MQNIRMQIKLPKVCIQSVQAKSVAGILIFEGEVCETKSRNVVLSLCNGEKDQGELFLLYMFESFFEEWFKTEKKRLFKEKESYPHENLKV